MIKKCILGFLLIQLAIFIGVSEFFGNVIFMFAAFIMVFIGALLVLAGISGGNVIPWSSDDPDAGKKLPHAGNDSEDKTE